MEGEAQIPDLLTGQHKTEYLKTGGVLQLGGGRLSVDPESELSRLLAFDSDLHQNRGTEIPGSGGEEHGKKCGGGCDLERNP